MDKWPNPLNFRYIRRSTDIKCGEFFAYNVNEEYYLMKKISKKVAASLYSGGKAQVDLICKSNGNKVIFGLEFEENKSVIGYCIVEKNKLTIPTKAYLLLHGATDAFKNI
jgi:hypothetical protein